MLIDSVLNLCCYCGQMLCILYGIDLPLSALATNLCFQEKAVYTQEVLAVVLQQLLEQFPIPTLFMRTVSAPVSQTSQVSLHEVILYVHLGYTIPGSC